jgi:hypothetical protein
LSHRIVIVPSRIEDVYRLAAAMRPRDRSEILAAGLDPRRAVRFCYRNAVYRQTAFVDGHIAAMWGMGGGMLSDEGTPWMISTEAVELCPLAFLKHYRDEVAKMLEIRRELTGYVHASYEGASRVLRLVGFTLAPAAPWGARGELFHHFSIRRS